MSENGEIYTAGMRQWQISPLAILSISKKTRKGKRLTQIFGWCPSVVNNWVEMGAADHSLHQTLHHMGPSPICVWCSSRFAKTLRLLRPVWCDDDDEDDDEDDGDDFLRLDDHQSVWCSSDCRKSCGIWPFEKSWVPLGKAGELQLLLMMVIWQRWQVWKWLWLW